MGCQKITMSIELTDRYLMNPVRSFSLFLSILFSVIHCTIDFIYGRYDRYLHSYITKTDPMLIECCAAGRHVGHTFTQVQRLAFCWVRSLPSLLCDFYYFVPLRIRPKSLVHRASGSINLLALTSFGSPDHLITSIR